VSVFFNEIDFIYQTNLRHDFSAVINFFLSVNYPIIIPLFYKSVSFRSALLVTLPGICMSESYLVYYLLPGPRIFIMKKHIAELEIDFDVFAWPASLLVKVCLSLSTFVYSKTCFCSSTSNRSISRQQIEDVCRKI